MQKTTSKRVEALEAAESQRIDRLVRRFAVQLAKAWAQATLVEHIVSIILETRDPTSDAEVAIQRRCEELYQRFGLPAIERELLRLMSPEELQRRRDAVYREARERAQGALSLSADDELLVEVVPAVRPLYDRLTEEELHRVIDGPPGTLGLLLRDLAQKYGMWSVEGDLAGTMV